MTNRSPALRVLALLLGGLLLVVAGFGAQRNLHVCKASGTVAALGTQQDCCVADAGQSCCKTGECHCAGEDHKPQPRKESPEGPTSVGGGCDSGCCVAVTVHVDNGPLPRHLELDHEAPPCCVLTSSGPLGLHTPACGILPPSTGPPRDDPGAALRRTVQLQI